MLADSSESTGSCRLQQHRVFGDGWTVGCHDTHATPVGPAAQRPSAADQCQPMACELLLCEGAVCSTPKKRLRQRLAIGMMHISRATVGFLQMNAILFAFCLVLKPVSSAAAQDADTRHTSKVFSTCSRCSRYATLLVPNLNAQRRIKTDCSACLEDPATPRVVADALAVLLAMKFAVMLPSAPEHIEEHGAGHEASCSVCEGVLSGRRLSPVSGEGWDWILQLCSNCILSEAPANSTRLKWFISHCLSRTYLHTNLTSDKRSMYAANVSSTPTISRYPDCTGLTVDANSTGSQLVYGKWVHVLQAIEGRLPAPKAPWGKDIEQLLTALEWGDIYMACQLVTQQSLQTILWMLNATALRVMVSAVAMNYRRRCLRSRTGRGPRGMRAHRQSGTTAGQPFGSKIQQPKSAWYRRWLSRVRPVVPFILQEAKSTWCWAWQPLLCREITRNLSVLSGMLVLSLATQSHVYVGSYQLWSEPPSVFLQMRRAAYNSVDATSYGSDVFLLLHNLFVHYVTWPSLLHWLFGMLVAAVHVTLCLVAPVGWLVHVSWRFFRGDSPAAATSAQKHEQAAAAGRAQKTVKAAAQLQPVMQSQQHTRKVRKTASGRNSSSSTHSNADTPARTAECRSFGNSACCSRENKARDSSNSRHEGQVAVVSAGPHVVQRATVSGTAASTNGSSSSSSSTAGLHHVLTTEQPLDDSIGSRRRGSVTVAEGASEWACQVLATSVDGQQAASVAGMSRDTSDSTTEQHMLSLTSSENHLALSTPAVHIQGGEQAKDAVSQALAAPASRSCDSVQVCCEPPQQKPAAAGRGPAVAWGQPLAAMTVADADGARRTNAHGLLWAFTAEGLSMEASDVSSSPSSHSSSSCSSVKTLPSSSHDSVNAAFAELQPLQQAPSTDMAQDAIGSVSLTDGAADVSDAGDCEDVCVVCWEGARTQGLVHGNVIHLCLCSRCVELYDYASLGCPMCRQIVQAVIVIP